MGQSDSSKLNTRRLEDVKAQEMHLVNEILLHEVYFDSIGESGGEKLENTALDTAISASFSSVDNWCKDFLQLASRLGYKDGWVVLAWSERLRRLINLALPDSANGLFGAEPLLALDLHGHAYEEHFGDHSTTYIEAFVRNIDWQRIGTRFDVARSDAAITSTSQPDETQITVDQLKALIEGKTDAPLVLDVRHDDDCERYRKRVRIMGSE